MTVWTGKRDGFSTRETWTTDEFPNYWITHDDGASFYVAGHRVAGPIGRADKFFKAEDMVRRDAAQSTLETSSVTPAWVDQSADPIGPDRSGDPDYSEREQTGEDITDYDLFTRSE